jgi:hypothetical protein
MGFVSGGDLDKTYEAKLWGIFLTPFSPAVRADRLDTNALLNLRIFDPEYRQALLTQLEKGEKVTLGFGDNAVTYPYMFATHKWPENYITPDQRLAYLDEFYGEKVGWKDIDPEKLFVKSFTVEKPINAENTLFFPKNE